MGVAYPTGSSTAPRCCCSSVRHACMSRDHGSKSLRVNTMELVTYTMSMSSTGSEAAGAEKVGTNSAAGCKQCKHRHTERGLGFQVMVTLTAGIEREFFDIREFFEGVFVGRFGARRCGGSSRGGGGAGGGGGSPGLASYNPCKPLSDTHQWSKADACNCHAKPHRNTFPLRFCRHCRISAIELTAQSRV